VFFPLDSIVKLGNCKTDPKIRTHINRQTVVKRCKFVCKRPNLTDTNPLPGQTQNWKEIQRAQSSALGESKEKQLLQLAGEREIERESEWETLH